MSGPPSLSDLLNQRHNYILRNLRDAASFIAHPTEKGDATEQVWLDALRTYLPDRYDVRRGFVIDCYSNYSKQLDIIIHDRFYTPFLLRVGGYHVVPVESVYAVFEVKQEINSKNLKAAQEKAESVRILKRNYRPTREVPNHAGKDILAGILATRSTFADQLGKAVMDRINTPNGDERLDYLCVGESGWIVRRTEQFIVETAGSWITSFILDLVESLQNLGTVPPINIASYRSASS